MRSSGVKITNSPVGEYLNLNPPEQEEAIWRSNQTSPILSKARLGGAGCRVSTFIIDCLRCGSKDLEN